MKTVVTGHGRSGTTWLASVLDPIVGAVHEPENYEDFGGRVVVDCRLRYRRRQLEREGYRLVHLVRDGRDVVRSTYSFYDGQRPFEEVCRGWADAVDACEGLPTVRLEDVTAPLNAAVVHRMPHWAEWDSEHVDTFERVCGGQLRRHGYA